MRNFIFYLIAVLIVPSCNLIYQANIDPDWVELPPPEPIETDTCLHPIEYTDPAFVTGYMYITDDIQTDRILIVNNGSVVITQANEHLIGFYLDSLLTLWKPQYSYQVFFDDEDTRKLCVIVDGTNDRQQFYLKAQIRYNGVKHYFGWATQAYHFFGALTVEEYKQVIVDYPSVNRFDFFGTAYDSTDYTGLALQILGECKEGRYWADFRHNPFPIPDSIITAFETAGWEVVLH